MPGPVSVSRCMRVCVLLLYKVAGTALKVIVLLTFSCTENITMCFRVRVLRT